MKRQRGPTEGDKAAIEANQGKQQLSQGPIDRLNSSGERTDTVVDSCIKGCAEPAGSSMPGLWHEWSNSFPSINIPRPSPEDTRRLGDLPYPAAKRSYPPGQHGQARRKRSEYAIRLEKQKLFNYGVSERQLVRYVKRAQDGSTTNLPSSKTDSTTSASASASAPPFPVPVSW